MIFTKSCPVESFVHAEDVKNGKLVMGAKVFIKNKDLPADPAWTHLIVYEYRSHVLGIVPLDRERNRTRVITKVAAGFQGVRSSLVHIPQPEGFVWNPQTEDDSTPMGNGNGCTPIIVASTDP